MPVQYQIVINIQSENEAFEEHLLNQNIVTSFKNLLIITLPFQELSLPLNSAKNVPRFLYKSQWSPRVSFSVAIMSELAWLLAWTWKLIHEKAAFTPFQVMSARRGSHAQNIAVHLKKIRAFDSQALNLNAQYLFGRDDAARFLYDSLISVCHKTECVGNAK